MLIKMENGEGNDRNAGNDFIENHITKQYAECLQTVEF